MIRTIVHDETFLSQPSLPATVMDLQTVTDLKDTLADNADRCVGMAANMIGVKRNIIVFDDGGISRVMLNPEIVSASGEYEALEGCLSLEGERTAKRYRKITVSFQNEQMERKTEKFRDFTAQIIQHEIDHTKGILI